MRVSMSSLTSAIQHGCEAPSGLGATFGRSLTRRLALYERSVAHWATNTSTPVIFAENSGFDLAPLRRHVPNRGSGPSSFRSPNHECKILGEQRHAVLRAPVLAIALAVDDSDLIFLVTARYAFLHDFESTVRLACGRCRSWCFKIRHGDLSIIVRRRPFSASTGDLRAICLGGRCRRHRRHTFRDSLIKRAHQNALNAAAARDTA